MAADLESRGVRADAVGVVDGGGGEPEHALFDLTEGGEQLLPAGARRRRRVRDHHRTSGTGGAVRGPAAGWLRPVAEAAGAKLSLWFVSRHSPFRLHKIRLSG